MAGQEEVLTFRHEETECRSLLVMEEDKMRRLVFVIPAVLAFMFVLIAILQGSNTTVSAAGTCEDRLLPSTSFKCTVQDEAGNLSPDMTLDFDSGGPGDFHVLVNKLFNKDLTLRGALYRW